MNDEKKDKRDVLAGRDFYIDLEKNSSSPYGVTQHYDRRNYEDHGALEKFRDQAFSNKEGNSLKTTRTPDGQLVYRKRIDAENRFGSEKASFHSADVDHIDPLKSVHNRHKGNAFITDKDIKDVTNRKDNLGLKTSHDNRRKQAVSELQEGLRNGNIEQAVNGVATQAVTDALLTGRAVQRAAETFVQGASDAIASSVIPLMVTGTKDLIKLANREMTLKEAIEDVGTTGVSIAVSGGGVRVASYALSGMIEQSGNEILKELARANQIGTVVIAATIVAKAASKYISGEIDGIGFWEEISTEGLTMIAGIAGGAIGGPVGTIIASAACSILLSSIEKMNKAYTSIEENQKAYLKRLDIIAKNAKEELQAQRALIKAELEQAQLVWHQATVEGFDAILEGAFENDLQTIACGINRIMELFPTEEKIKLMQSTDDVRCFLSQEKPVFPL